MNYEEGVVDDTLHTKKGYKSRIYLGNIIGGHILKNRRYAEDIVLIKATEIKATTISTESGEGKRE